MTTGADKDSKERSFRLSDLFWVICFVGLAILVIFTGISLWETWQTSTLNRQFLGR